MRTKTLLLFGASALTATLLITACQSTSRTKADATPIAWSGESLLRPVGYREWVFVGEPLTPNDMNAGKAAFPEFHSVYIDPASYEHYARTGEFRDGTVLVKELVSVGSKGAVSGNGYFMGEFIGLEATVKSAERFPDEPGNWAYFSFTQPDGPPAPSAEAFPAASCNACHDESAADDFVFTQYYPVLSAVKGTGPLPRYSSQPFSIDSSGKLERPEGYREWVFVGEPVTPNDLNSGKAAFPEFHNVYIDPASFESYSRTGEFRDGTILVKELVSVGSKAAVSGKGYFMGDFIGLEATIKSSKHFPNEPGNWAYFSFTQPGGPPASIAEAFPTASCNACHDESAAEDFVFTQYYPVLRAANPHGSVPETSQAMDSNDPWSPSAPTPGGRFGGLPLQQEGLFSYLSSGEYRQFPASEGAAHPGRGPHTAVTRPVRVFYNDVLAASLESGADQHPEGAVAVKEMFSDSNELEGWAVMAKTQAETAGGDGWFWYEVTSASDSSALAAMGNGVTGCVDCHSFRDSDMILSGYPLR